MLTWFWFSLPLTLFKAPTSFVVEADNGELLSASIASDGQWRFPANDSVPEKFAKCITVYEDNRFFYHPGFDPLAMARAISQNLNAKRVVSGGSTLTMQVIRLSRNRPRTIWQKIIELIVALRLEMTFSKKEILTLYAGNAPFGTNVIGLEAAAWRYFGRSADKLSWGETATLAVLPNSPSLVHPGRNRNSLLAKRNRLLDRLQTEKVIDPVTCRLARLEPIPDKPLPLPQLAPHLLSRFKADYKKQPEGVTLIKSTVKLALQQNVSSLLQRYHQTLKANGINNAAALVLDVETGNALAYVGNINEPNNPEMESYVDMIPSLRSPGSTLKPLLYASMLTDGLILPNTLIPDIPTQIGGYTPQNFDLGYDGAIPASKALSRSLNIPAVKMLQQYKYERFHQQLKKLGMTTLVKPADFYGLSLILGGCETSMWELSGIYASMARTLNHFDQNNRQYDQADYHAPKYILKTLEKSEHSKSPSSVIDYGSLWFTFQAMQEVMRPGEEGLWEQFSSSQKIGWKTGTSFGFRDGWAIGSTSKYVVCVWVGNADGEGRPGLTGIETAAPILFDIFDLLPRSDWFKSPVDRLMRIEVCRQSGFRAGKNCPDKDTTFVQIPGVKSPVCPYHQLVHLDKTGTFQVTSDCESPENMLHKSWFVLPPSMEYYYKLRHRDYESLPAFKTSCLINQDDYRPMELIYPKNNAKVYIPVEIDGSRGKMILNAAHRNSEAKIFWHLDNQYIATTTDYHELALSPPDGKHTITLIDDKGNRLVQVFEVLDKKR
ncbi:penicillin-binding protein 1C [Pedobacter sp. HMF7647]|uniref:peptidoglycan glycosyltransferase n=2 Tax=Hufsiella arboris TaxID=2695275 RepID=A0A7K1Y7A8_9SPHI|nr:penicillin-binding protein 1C [Hufsiella arboris]